MIDRDYFFYIPCQIGQQMTVKEMIIVLDRGIEV